MVKSNKKKMAYLIMAHENTNILKILLELIDDVRNDIFIHIDKKSEDFSSMLRCKIKKSKLYFVKNRVSVYWAHFSQVKAEYSLFQLAFNKGPYMYYHLLSASDLPIKSQNYIHNFFSNSHNQEYIGFIKDFQLDFYERIRIFPKSLRETRGFKASLRYRFLLLQRFLGYKKSIPIKIAKGPNWVSITNSFVEELLKYKGYFLNNFRYSRSLDECYKQSVAINQETILKRINLLTDEYEGCMRLIDWERGMPYKYTINDLSEILSSNRIFCRKIEDEKLGYKLLEIFKNE